MPTDLIVAFTAVKTKGTLYLGINLLIIKLLRIDLTKTKQAVSQSIVKMYI